MQHIIGAKFLFFFLILLSSLGLVVFFSGRVKNAHIYTFIQPIYTSLHVVYP